MMGNTLGFPWPKGQYLGGTRIPDFGAQVQAAANLSQLHENSAARAAQVEDGGALLLHLRSRVWDSVWDSTFRVHDLESGLQDLG